MSTSFTGCLPYCVVLPILLWLFSFWQIKHDDDDVCLLARLCGNCLMDRLQNVRPRRIRTQRWPNITICAKSDRGRWNAKRRIFISASFAKVPYLTLTDTLLLRDCRHIVSRCNVYILYDDPCLSQRSPSERWPFLFHGSSPCCSCSSAPPSAVWHPLECRHAEWGVVHPVADPGGGGWGGRPL